MKKLYLIGLILLSGIKVSQAQSSAEIEKKTEWTTLIEQNGITIQWKCDGECDQSNSISYRIVNLSPVNTFVVLNLPSTVLNQPQSADGKLTVNVKLGETLTGNCGVESTLHWTFAKGITYIPSAADISFATIGEPIK